MSEKPHVYWDETEQCFVVPEGACPYPIKGDDGSTESCRANDHCGCAEGPFHQTARVG